MLHIASRGVGNADSYNFVDINGQFSNGGAGTVATIAFDTGFANPKFFGTSVPVTGFPAITFGTIYNGSEDDYTAKFISCTARLNTLVTAANADGAKAVIIGGSSGVVPGMIKQQAQVSDFSNFLRVTGTNGYSQSNPAAGTGVEIIAQDPLAGDQGLINSINRATSAWKALTLQAASVTVAPSGSTVATFNSAGMTLATSKSLTITGVAFASLGTPAAGTIFYCSDCTVTGAGDNTCTSGGTGALAVRLNGVWRCFNAQN